MEVEAQPEPEAEPVMEAEPETRTEPIVETEPEIEAEPEVEAEPEADEFGDALPAVAVDEEKAQDADTAAGGQKQAENVITEIEPAYFTVTVGQRIEASQKMLSDDAFDPDDLASWSASSSAVDATVTAVSRKTNGSGFIYKITCELTGAEAEDDVSVKISVHGNVVGYLYGHVMSDEKQTLVETEPEVE